jgi:hypothetical protein
MFIINFIKNFSITKFLLITTSLIIVYSVGSALLMVNREVQFDNIDPQILSAVQEHKILSAGEQVVIFKTLSRYDNSSFLLITNQRLLIIKDWQEQSINLSEITNVIVTTMFLKLSIVRIQTKEHFFEVEIENQNLDRVLTALQVDPKLIIYRNHADKPS